MRKMILLTKILLKNGAGADSGIGKKRPMLLMLAVLGLAFTPLVIQLVDFIAKVYDILSGIQQEGIIFSFGLALTSFVIFFFGIFYVINTFYFAEDVENLLPLPLKSWQILGAKFLTVTLYEYLTEAIIMLPLLVVFGIKSNAGILYYLYGALVFLLLPIIPLVISSVFVMIIMRFTNTAKNKDRFKMMGGIFAIFLAIGLNTLMQRYLYNAQDAQQLQKMLLEGKNSLVEITSSLFPSARFAAQSLIDSSTLSGLAGFVLFLGITAVFFILFLHLGEFLYFKGVIGISEASARRKAINSEKLSRSVVKQSAIRAYTLKELKLLFRTPIYFINCVLINFLWPVFLLIPLFTQPEILNELDQLKGFLQDSQSAGYVLSGAFAFIIFIASTNGVTATSISREGQALFVNKYLPISYKDQIISKVLSGVLIAIIGMTTLILVAAFLLQPPIHLIILVLATGILGILFCSFAGMILDLYNPKLNWDNEQKAVKQNINVFFHMLIGMVFAGLTVMAAIFLKLNLLQCTVLLVAAYGLLDFILYKFLSIQGVKLYNKLEG